MTSQYRSLSLTTARTMRLLTMIDIEAAMKKLIAHEDYLKKSLQEDAPASVAQFLENEGTIDDLFRHGQSIRKIVYEDNPYDFKDAEQVKSAFRALKKVWKNAVKITFSDDEPHRIEVNIKVP